MDYWELFDLTKDPMEMQNVYGDPAYAEVQAHRHQQLEALRDQYQDNDSLSQQFIDEYQEKVKANPLVEYWKLSPEEMRRLYAEYLQQQARGE